MDIAFLFRPLDNAVFQDLHTPYCLGHQVAAFLTEFPDWEEADVVIYGCPSYEGSVFPYPDHDENSIEDSAPDLVRKELYELQAPSDKPLRIADLGNITPRSTLEETLDAITYVTEILLKFHKLVIIIGGSQDLTYGVYRSFEHLGRNLEYVSIDYLPDIYDSEVNLTNRSFNHAILTHTPDYLYHFTTLGAQLHYLSLEEQQALKKLNFELVRLADIRKHNLASEPYLRNANLISIDLSSVRGGDAPGAAFVNPAGLTSEELCQMMRFIGKGYGVQALVLSEISSWYDYRGLTTRLAGLALWYLLEAFSQRFDDHPLPDRSNMNKYRVGLEGAITEVVFYQHRFTGRWWMEVPSPRKALLNYGYNQLVPCTKYDYEQTIEDGELPERWWTFHYKIK